LKRDVDKYFEENKPYAGLGRTSLLSGVTYVAARAVNIIVQVASTIILARLLSPHDFGLIAMVLALVGFAPMLIDLGTSDASTQKTRITEAEVSTLFWLNMAIGVALTVLLAQARVRSRPFTSMGQGRSGYFQNAFLIYSNLTGILTESLHSIATSSLSKLRNDVEELKRSWASALSLASFISAGFV
jgi:O-antigen/teichoic acid export membrane protein